MEQIDMMFCKNEFPNVFAAYGNSTGNVIKEMSRYTKGRESKEKISSLLSILEENLERERNLYISSIVVWFVM